DHGTEAGHDGDGDSRRGAAALGRGPALVGQASSPVLFRIGAGEDACPTGRGRGWRTTLTVAVFRAGWTPAALAGEAVRQLDRGREPKTFPSRALLDSDAAKFKLPVLRLQADRPRGGNLHGLLQDQLAIAAADGFGPRHRHVDLVPAADLEVLDVA